MQRVSIILLHLFLLLTTLSAEHALETLQENAYIRLGQRCGYDIKWICANPKVREKCNVERFCEFFWSYYVYMKTYNHDNVPNLPEASTLFV
uniref:Venom protein n=1 Tax=Ampulex compressa TaxID=860918 RepID=A0A1W6EVT4_AMPCP|nr:venom protein [Ampulex compressa]